MPPSCDRAPSRVRITRSFNTSDCAMVSRPADQIGILAHQPDRFFARGRGFFHLHFAIQLISRVEEQLVIALADQRIDLGFGQAFVEVDLFILDSLVAQETPGIAAGGSSGLQIEFQLRHWTGFPSSSNTISLGRIVCAVVGGGGAPGSALREITTPWPPISAMYCFPST